MEIVRTQAICALNGDGIGNTEIQKKGRAGRRSVTNVFLAYRRESDAYYYVEIIKYHCKDSRILCRMDNRRTFTCITSDVITVYGDDVKKL